MLIYFIKFVHLICVLGLVGSTAYCATARTLPSLSTNAILFRRLHKAILHCALLAMITGTFLVYPAAFTFHTPWIKAAYFLVAVFCLTVLATKKIQHPLLLRSLYFILFVILVLVIHDAVTKTTFLF